MWVFIFFLNFPKLFTNFPNASQKIVSLPHQILSCYFVNWTNCKHFLKTTYHLLVLPWQIQLKAQCHEHLKIIFLEKWKFEWIFFQNFFNFSKKFLNFPMLPKCLFEFPITSWVVILIIWQNCKYLLKTSWLHLLLLWQSHLKSLRWPANNSLVMCHWAQRARWHFIFLHDSVSMG